jgi:tRNA(Arg) A34 adenosine deaminase TadA
MRVGPLRADRRFALAGRAAATAMTAVAAIRLELPAWIAEIDMARVHESDADKMALAIELSRRNVAAGTGGPFGAAVFGPDHRVVSLGVNRVQACQCSVAHAEMLALGSAQQATGRYRLNLDTGPVTLATSSQPCAMCYGALVWAGIDVLLIGARSDDVQSLAGFDEGPLPADWVGELERRGIAVRRDLSREQACAVLRAYGESGLVY